MKKLILLCVLLAQIAFGQQKVKDFSFALLPTTYTSISGGTVFQTGTQLNVDSSVEVTLPFSFTICGNVYTKCRVYSNGFITFGYGYSAAFGVSKVMSAAVKIPTANTFEAWSRDYTVSVFGANVVASNYGTPEIRYGLNSSGDFVIQYQDIAVSGFTLSRATCQIVLKLDGKTIQFIYAGNNVGQSNIVSPEVGIQGKAELINNIFVYNDWTTRGVPKFSNANIIEPNPNYPNNSNGKLSSSTVSWSANDAGSPYPPTVLPSNRIFQYSQN